MMTLKQTSVPDSPWRRSNFRWLTQNEWAVINRAIDSSDQNVMGPRLTICDKSVFAQRRERERERQVRIVRQSDGNFCGSYVDTPAQPVLLWHRHKSDFYIAEVPSWRTRWIKRMTLFQLRGIDIKDRVCVPRRDDTAHRDKRFIQPPTYIQDI